MAERKRWHATQTEWRRRGSTSKSRGGISTPQFPWNMPARETLVNGEHPVFTHYFTQYPIRISGSHDYYADVYGPPGFQEMSGTTVVKDHRPWGGTTRDEPEDASGPFPAPTGYRIDDKVKEIQDAIWGYMDGFTVDMLSISAAAGGHFAYYRELMQAFAKLNDPYFHHLAMPDGTASATRDTNFASLQACLVECVNDPYHYQMPNGKFPIIPFSPESAPENAGSSTNATSWNNGKWKTLMDGVAADSGKTIAFGGCYVDSWTSSRCAPMYASMSDINSRWGDRSYTAASDPGTGNRGAVAYNAKTFPGKLWMHFVAPQDTRPNQHTFWENQNTEAYRRMWMAAIETGADWIQIPTYNDYSESAHIARSKNHKRFWLALGTYFIVWFKTGSPPEIVRDGAFLTHRIHHYTDRTIQTATQTSFQTPGDSAAVTNNVESLVFLTSPATVYVNGGAGEQSFSGAAGMNSFKVPLTAGGTVPSTRIVRSGVTTVSVTGTATTTTPLVEDLDYRAFYAVVA